MSTATTVNRASRDTFSVSRIAIYAALILAAVIFLLPLYVMIVTSFKTLAEVQSGNMLALPTAPTIEPWISAWSTACIGLNCGGISPYFVNSVAMVVPAVIIGVAIGSLNGYILTKWRFPGDQWVFGLMLFGCFIPFQAVLLPMARFLGLVGLANTTPGLVLVHVVYGIGFNTLFFRNYFKSFPDELVKAAQVDGASFFTIYRRIMLPNAGPMIVVTTIFQFTNIWNDFLFGASFAAGDSAPITIALNNLVNSSTGVKEYNVHMAGAMIAALPTLLVYVLAGRYFVRGLMSGAVKG